MSDGKEVIGFIGVGFMGHGMARNLLQKGYPLVVRGNRNRVPVESLVSLGAREAGSAREMAESCDIIHLCLSNSAQVEAVMGGADGILAGARPGLTVIDTTTANPDSTMALAAALAEKGGVLVDAPLGRTPKEAEEGTLDAMVGASAADFARLRPVIECWAANINHVGPTGTGHKMKLLMNFISMGYAALYGEALSIGAKAGVAPEVLRRVIGSSRLTNGFFETFMTAAVGRDLEVHKFTIVNGAKDTRYLAAMATNAGAVPRLGDAIKNYFAEAVATGHGDDFVPQIADVIAAMNGFDLAEAVEASKG